MSGTGPNNVVAAGRPNQAKKPRMSRKMAHALDLFISGVAKSQQDAADKAGITREHLCREMKTDHARAYIVRRTSEMFASLAPKALRALDMAMEGDNKAAAVTASLAVLKQLGIVNPDAPSVSISLQQPGYVIDLSGGDGSRARVIDGELAQPADGGRDDAEAGT